MDTTLDGSFTSAGTQFILDLPSGYTEFRMVNITDAGSAAANTNVMRAAGYSQLPAGYAYRNLKTNGAATLQIESMITTAGFTFYDASNPPVFAATAVTAVTGASPAQVTSAAHGLAQGDTVELYGLNGTMTIMSGLRFTVNSIVDANNFTITFDASGAAISATPATAGFAQKVLPYQQIPRNVVVGPTATINSNNLLQLCLNQVPSVNQFPSQYAPFQSPYQIGAILRFYVPQISATQLGFGLPSTANFLYLQITGYAAAAAGYNYQNILQCSILPGNLSNAITTAAGLPALTYPAAGAVPHSSYPFVTDVAETSGILSEAEDNANVRGIIIGTGVQTTGKLYQWFARKGFSI